MLSATVVSTDLEEAQAGGLGLRGAEQQERRVQGHHYPRTASSRQTLGAAAQACARQGPYVASAGRLEFEMDGEICHRWDLARA